MIKFKVIFINLIKSITCFVRFIHVTNIFVREIESALVLAFSKLYLYLLKTMI